METTNETASGMGPGDAGRKTVTGGAWIGPASAIGTTLGEEAPTKMGHKYEGVILPPEMRTALLKRTAKEDRGPSAIAREALWRYLHPDEDPEEYEDQVAEKRRALPKHIPHLLIVYLDDELAAEMAERAEADGRKKAEVIRLALGAYLGVTVATPRTDIRADETSKVWDLYKSNDPWYSLSEIGVMMGGISKQAVQKRLRVYCADNDMDYAAEMAQRTRDFDAYLAERNGREATVKRAAVKARSVRQRSEIEAREEQVLTLADSFSYREIAEQLGIHPITVQRDINRARARREAEAAAQAEAEATKVEAAPKARGRAKKPLS